MCVCVSMCMCNFPPNTSSSSSLCICHTQKWPWGRHIGPRLTHSFPKRLWMLQPPFKQLLLYIPYRCRHWVSAARSATGSIPSCPANGETEAVVRTDRRKEDWRDMNKEGEISTETEKAEAERCESKERMTCEIDRERKLKWDGERGRERERWNKGRVRWGSEWALWSRAPWEVQPNHL